MEDIHDTHSSTELQAFQVNDFAHIENVKAAHVTVSIQERSLGRRKCIRRVSPHLRRDNSQQVYDPTVFSLGPYHYGEPQLCQMEKIKDEVLNKFVSDSIASDATKDRGFFYREVLESINEIRDNYEHAGVDEYNDEALAEIILRDSCFLISYIEDVFWISGLICDHLGMSTAVYMQQDFHMLENQIPYWIIKHLLDLRFGEDEATKLVCQHLSLACLWNYRELSRLPWEDKERQPLHLLEAHRTTLLEQEDKEEGTPESKPHFLTKLYKRRKIWKTRNRNNSSTLSLSKLVNLPFRSVTYLQAKGVHFAPSTNCYKDVIFTSHSFYGMLQLPIDVITGDTKAFLSNLIAFEMSPGNPSVDFVVTSYVNFMKSLIESSKDVKELREKGILFSDLGSDEEVVKLYKEIHTYGIDDYDSFAHVKMQIDEHCNSRAKTWIAEFTHDYFHSPWAAIALFAATFLLCLTFLQTYYTIRPAK